MLKKVISLFLIIVMLVSFSSAVAADENASQPTIEEILNGYHEKAFAAQTAGENDGASTYSLRSGSEKTLEQETVEELTAAGYEAYNVTADNYEHLEKTLKTDFYDMGLDPEGSYIVVINGVGDDASSAATSRSSDITLPPHYDYDIGVEDGQEYVIYKGQIYYCRYITVTTVEDSGLRTDSVYFVPYIDLMDAMDAVGATLLTAGLYTGLDAAVPVAPVGTIADFLNSSIAGLTPENFSVTESDELSIIATSYWTRQYIQVWDADLEAWKYAQSSAYVNSRTYATGYLSTPGSVHPTRFVGDEITFVKYSSKYKDYIQRKTDAVIAFLAGTQSHDTTGNVCFYWEKEYTPGMARNPDEAIFVHEEQFGTGSGG